MNRFTRERREEIGSLFGVRHYSALFDVRHIFAEEPCLTFISRRRLMPGEPLHNGRFSGILSAEGDKMLPRPSYYPEITSFGCRHFALPS
jgi:hypothetical protein